MTLQPVGSNSSAPQAKAPTAADGKPPSDSVELGAITPEAVAKCPFLAAQAAAAPAATAAPATADATPPPAPDPLLTTWQNPAPTSPEDREKMLEGITNLQNQLHAAGKVSSLDRGFHQKQNWGGKARVVFNDDLPKFLRWDALKNVAGHEFVSAVRFSNGQGCPYMDSTPDVRGMALKMNIGGQEVDLLATNSITFARDARQFMKFAEIAGTMQADGKIAAGEELASKIFHHEDNAKEAARMAFDLAEATARKVKHPAAESYWSQPMQVGPYVGRFVFTPESGANSKPPHFFPDHNYLRKNMETDLEHGPIKMKISFEAFTDDAAIKDAHIHGKHVTYPIGEVIIDKRPAQGRDAEEKLVSEMAFNPEHGMKMAGTMNESNRGAIYEQSAHNRHALEWSDPQV
ncbi:MAG: catalase family protein, partial [Candidatus Xenobia bacterium]